MQRCNFEWYSPGYRQRVCCTHYGNHVIHENGRAFVMVGSENAVPDGRWINQNLEAARELVKEISELKEIQRRLKDAFAKDELDGGALTALDHPLYLQASEEINRLEEEFKQLI